MFGSLFRLGMLATLVGGSAVALVGPERVKLYIASGKDAVLSAIDEAQGMESKLNLIHTQIKGLDKEARELREAAIRRDVEVGDLRREIAGREDALQRKSDLLSQVKVMLASGDGQYRIGGRTYARTAIEQDASEKLAAFTVQTETLASLKQTLETKEKAAAIAAENVERAAALRTELSTQVGLLQAKLDKLRAKENFAATVDEITDTSDLDSDLARAREMMREFEKDLEVKDRLIDEKLKQSSQQPAQGIDYETLQQGESDLVGRIDKALSAAQTTHGTTAVAKVVVH